MKNLLSLLLLLSSLGLQAQIEKGTWSLEGYYTPQYFELDSFPLSEAKTTLLPSSKYF